MGRIERHQPGPGDRPGQPLAVGGRRRDVVGAGHDQRAGAHLRCRRAQVGVAQRRAAAQVARDRHAQERRPGARHHLGRGGPERRREPAVHRRVGQRVQTVAGGDPHPLVPERHRSDARRGVGQHQAVDAIGSVDAPARARSARRSTRRRRGRGRSRRGPSARTRPGRADRSCRGRPARPTRRARACRSAAPGTGRRRRRSGDPTGRGRCRASSTAPAAAPRSGPLSV